MVNETEEMATNEYCEYEHVFFEESRPGHACNVLLKEKLGPDEKGGMKILGLASLVTDRSYITTTLTFSMARPEFWPFYDFLDTCSEVTTAE